MRKKIIFLVSNLRPGGAQRVYSYVPQQLCNKKYDCTLLVVGSEDEAVYDTGELNVVYLNKKRLRDAFYQLYRFIKKKQPDIVFGTIGHINIFLGLIKLINARLTIIIREASVISVMSNYADKHKFANMGHLLAKWVYPKVDAIICQSSDMAEDFKHLFEVKEDRLYIIGNPITNNNNHNLTSYPLQSTRRFITVGRLSREKGHERILRNLRNLHEDFIYTIVGDGPEKASLVSLTKELDINHKVKFISYSNKIDKLLLDHDLFLQGSYVEGFPNAVLESCALGTPVLAFNVPGGTKDIIVDSVNGYLVDTEEQFVSKLQSSNSTWQRESIAQSVFEKYDSNTIVSKYNDLIEKLN